MGVRMVGYVRAMDMCNGVQHILRRRPLAVKAGYVA